MSVFFLPFSALSARGFVHRLILFFCVLFFSLSRLVLCSPFYFCCFNSCGTLSVSFSFPPTSFCLTRRTRIESSPSVSQRMYIHTCITLILFLFALDRHSHLSLSLSCLYHSHLIIPHCSIVSLNPMSFLSLSLSLFPISHFPISLFQYCCMHASLSCLVLSFRLSSPLLSSPNIFCFSISVLSSQVSNSLSLKCWLLQYRRFEFFSVCVGGRGMVRGYLVDWDRPPK